MSSKHKICSAILFLIVIVITPVIFIFSKKSSYSAEENRMLSEMPEINMREISDKSYMHNLEKYLSDHFPERLKWVQAKMSFDRLSGKDIINGIYITDGMLIEELHEPDYKEVNKSVRAINDFAEHYKTDVFALIAPTSAGIYSELLPEFAPQPDQREFIVETCSNFSENINVIDVFDTMNREKEHYIYYRNDHHWTSYGAYCAYRTAIEKLGQTPVPIDEFYIDNYSSDFRGTFYSKCLYDKTAADTIDVFNCKNGVEVTDVICNDGVSETHYDSIYFMDYLDKKDKYCVFLGENRAYTNIKTNADNGKKLLVIKDSYANAFIPFLTQHYSEIAVIDLRYVKTSISDFVNPDDYEQTLFLYNASTFAEDKNIKIAGFFN